MISSDNLRGHLEPILLSLICKNDRYGYELFNEISERTNEGLIIKEATLYAVLQRLEKLGYISSYQGEISNGSKRRYYHITANGKKYFEEAVVLWKETKEIIDIFMEGEF